MDNYRQTGRTTKMLEAVKDYKKGTDVRVIIFCPTFRIARHVFTMARDMGIQLKSSEVCVLTNDFLPKLRGHYSEQVFYDHTIHDDQMVHYALQDKFFQELRCLV